MDQGEAGIQFDKEVVSKRTQTSRTFLTDKGAYAAVVYAGSINYKDPGGTWQPIDNALISSTTPGFAYENKANHYSLLLPANLCSPVQTVDGGTAIAFTLVNASPSSSAVVSGDTATYANAIPGVDVAYTAASDFAKESISLQGPTSPATFVYDLRLSSGLAAKASSAGGIEFVDASGTVKASIPAPFMEDASHTPAGRSHAVSLTLGQSASGQTLTVAADPAWLADPARKFPVVIDPTVSYLPNQDCSIASGSNADVNYCGDTEDETGLNSPNIFRSIVQINIQLAIPSNVNVLESYIGLYATLAQNSGPMAVSEHQVTQAWTTRDTWNTYDGTHAWRTPGGDFNSTAYYTNSSVGPATGQFYYWWQTELAQGWVNGTIPNGCRSFRGTYAALGMMLSA